MKGNRYRACAACSKRHNPANPCEPAPVEYDTTYHDVPFLKKNGGG